MGMGEKKRPVGMAILSLLHIAGGIFGAYYMISVLAQLGDNLGARQRFDVMGLPPVLLVVAAFFIFGLAIASGIGMWMGRRWGWYLGSFYYVYSIARSVNVIATIPVLMSSMSPGEVAGMSQAPSDYYLKHGARIVVHLLIFLYFFKGNVREFFSLTEQKKWKPVLAETGICIGIAAVFTIIARLGQGE